MPPEGPDDTDLQTPWLRDQLVDWLRQLGDRSQLETLRVPSGSESLDHLLDFFDDTGVLDDPGARIGYLLRDEREAEAMRRLGLVLDEALHSQKWGPVMANAREALEVMEVSTPYDD
ncbi:hypothetical protein [Streptomyces sp. NPDC085937]|uniref:SCO4402 family protein n=1 Tax=Streptomyces sp. NPDC085937 TaxID=3365742 RepID=UPI0037CDCAFD